MARVVQALFGTLTVLFIYGIGRRLFSENIARLASFGALFYPHHVFFGTWLIADPLFMALLPAALYLATFLLEKPRLWLSFAAGALIALGILAKPVGGFFGMFLGIWLLFLSPYPPVKRAGLALACAAGALVILSPWVIRNYIVFDSAFLSLNGGYTFLGANNAEAFGGHREGYPFIDSRGDEVEQLNGFYGEAWEWIRANPDDFAVLEVKKVKRLLSPLSIASKEEDFAVPLAPLVYVGYWAFLGVVLLGIFTWRRARVFIALIPLLSVFLSTVIFYGDARFMMPALPTLVLFGAGGMEKLWHMLPLPKPPMPRERQTAPI